MERFQEITDQTRCSFCGLNQRSVKKMIAGPSVFICDECVKLCCQILLEEGSFDPQAGFPDFDMESFLQSWIDGIAPGGTKRVDQARELLESLLSQLKSEDA